MRDADWGYDISDHSAIHADLGTTWDFDVLSTHAGEGLPPAGAAVVR